MIVRKSLGGALEIVSSAPHPGIARYRAEQLDKSIQWTEGLFKSESEETYKLEKNKELDLSALSKANDEAHLKALEDLSTPETHYKFAQHHSHLAGRAAAEPKVGDTAKDHDRNMRILMHTNEALKHYQMAGLNSHQTDQEHKKNMAAHASMDPNYKHPADSHALELAWTRKQRKMGKEPARVGGLGYNWAD